MCVYLAHLSRKGGLIVLNSLGFVDDAVFALLLCVYVFFDFLINFWSSVVASVALPQLCNIHCFFVCLCCFVATKKKRGGGEPTRRGP